MWMYMQERGWWKSWHWKSIFHIFTPVKITGWHWLWLADFSWKFVMLLLAATCCDLLTKALKKLKYLADSGWYILADNNQPLLADTGWISIVLPCGWYWLIFYCGWHWLNFYNIALWLKLAELLTLADTDWKSVWSGWQTLNFKLAYQVANTGWHSVVISSPLWVVILHWKPFVISVCTHWKAIISQL